MHRTSASGFWLFVVVFSIFKHIPVWFCHCASIWSPIFNHKLFFLGSSFAIAGANQSHPTTHTRITESHLTPCFRLTGQILPVSSSVSKPSSIVAEKVSEEQSGHRPVSLHTAEPSRLLPSHSPCELFRPRRFQLLVLFLHTSAHGLPREDSTDTRGSPPRSSREITRANWPDEF